MSSPDSRDTKLSESESQALYRELSQRASGRRRWRSVKGVGGRALAIGATAAVLVFSFASLAGLGSSDGEPGSGSNGAGYEIEDVYIAGLTSPPWSEGSPAVVTVAYRPVWSTNDYPGPIRCTWQVSDESGSVLGSGSQVVDSSREGGSTASLDIEIEEMGFASTPPVEGVMTALSASVACDEA